MARTEQRPVTRVRPEVGGRALRSVMAHHATGVAVAAASDGGEPIGMLVGTLASASLEPPLVVFLPGRASETFRRMRALPTFAFSVLGAEMDDVRRSFAAREQRHRWGGVSWRPAPSGAPILDGALAWVDCGYEDVYPAGDHYVVLGRVHALGAAPTGSPLLFHEGHYGTFTRSGLPTLGMDIA